MWSALPRPLNANETGVMIVTGGSVLSWNCEVVALIDVKVRVSIPAVPLTTTCAFETFTTSMVLKVKVCPVEVSVMVRGSGELLMRVIAPIALKFSVSPTVWPSPLIVTPTPSAA